MREVKRKKCCRRKAKIKMENVDDTCARVPPTLREGIKNMDQFLLNVCFNQQVVQVY